MEKPKGRELPHGVSRYRRLGCRCELCRAALRDAKRKRRQANLMPVQPLIDKFGDEFCRKHRDALKTWTVEGISLYVADRICCERGHHPYEIYGDEWFEKEWRKDEVETV